MVTIAIILLCFNVVLWVFLFLRLDRRFNAASMLESIRDEVDSITLVINKAADRSITLMDARKTELRELLAQVERQMALANESLDRLEKVERSERNGDAGYLFPTAPVSPLSRRTITEPPTPPASPETAPIAAEPSGVSATEPISSRQRARSLAATGLSTEAIADTLGLSVTEVELFTL